MSVLHFIQVVDHFKYGSSVFIMWFFMTVVEQEDTVVILNEDRHMLEVCLHLVSIVSKSLHDHFKNGRQCKAPVFLSCVLTRFMTVVEQEDTVIILIER